jgi:HupE / UreJ protein
MTRTRIWMVAIATIMMCSAGAAFAHDVAQGDRGYIATTTGAQFGSFFYLGAKHMVTGYDHLLFLTGVIFFLYGLRQIALYVTLFAIGHSTTLILGVLLGTSVSPYLIDAIIGLSVVYKALDNLGAFQRWLGFRPDVRAAVLVFGFFHGFGLATKLQDLGLSPDGLLPNLISFNLGVEFGQLLALAAILIAMSYWRRTASFNAHAFFANIVLMVAGFILFGYQMVGYFLEGAQV